MMTQSINIAEAKAKLSALIDRAAAGEEIVLSRAGRPVARLMPLEEQTPRQPGLLKHWQIPDDLFLEPMDEEDLRAAEGADTDEYGISPPRSK
jgi:prevent-host-death family protein